jgi:hypothetical protein
MKVALLSVFLCACALPLNGTGPIEDSPAPLDADIATDARVVAMPEAAAPDAPKLTFVQGEPKDAGLSVNSDDAEVERDAPSGCQGVMLGNLCLGSTTTDP